MPRTDTDQVYIDLFALNETDSGWQVLVDPSIEDLVLFFPKHHAWIEGDGVFKGRIRMLVDGEQARIAERRIEEYLSEMLEGR